MCAESRRITIWITGDQCSLANSALKAADKKNSKVLMIESVERGNWLPYHKKKLVLIYSIMRHFAEDLKDAGWDLDYYEEQSSFKAALKKHLDSYDPTDIYMMEQSEIGMSEQVKSLLESRGLKEFPHCNFVSTRKDFEALHKNAESRVTMDRFYRVMRKKTGLLLDAGGEPVGGEWNYDKENRKPPSNSLASTDILTFPPDKITNSVIKMVEKHFPDHPGSTDNWIYAVTRKDALKAAKDFFENRLDRFGPHQDAMIFGEPFLNHSILSPYINTCLLHPLELCKEAESRYRAKKAQLSSVEGFIRQIIGWREFVWRVYWRMMPEYKQLNELNATTKLPEFFWTGETKMRCMKDALNAVLEHGYAHHIIRLMVLGNFALIAGLDPQETNDWFHTMFVDGYDWVMVPNVIGMTLHADGGYVGTKPYAASANYINKMSDYCKGCHYKRDEVFGEDACPFNSLYWDFLIRNEEKFASNHRMSLVLKSLAYKDDKWKLEIGKRADELRASDFA